MSVGVTFNRITLFACLAFAPALCAEVLYQTGFEPSEGYTAGTLAGQNGWTGISGQVVETTTVFAGSQAVQFNATGAFDFATHQVNPSPLEDIVTLDVHFMQSSAGVASFWDPISVFGDQGFMAQLEIDPAGNVFLGLPSSNVGSVPVTRGVWHEFKMVLSFGTQTVTGYVDGTLIGSGPYGSPTSKFVAFIQQGTFAFGGESDSGFWDNVSVVAQSLDAYQVSYAANLGAGQSVIDVTNSGTVDPPAVLPDYLCVNVYTFAEDQQLISCCTCNLSPNDLQTLSVQNDLINNTLTPGVPTGVTVALVATDNGTGAGACNAATVTTSNLAAGMRAWGTTLHTAPGGGFAVTEKEFSKASLSAAELAKMTSYCGFIQANGSHFGICNSCTQGAAGSSKK